MKKTKLDFILWYNDIDLTYIQKKSGVCYPVLIELKKGVDKKFNPRTLKAVAEALGPSIKVDDFYNETEGKHRFYGEKKK